MSHYLGSVYKIVSTLVFAGMLICIKAVGDRIPPGEVVFFRSAVGLLPVVVWLAWRGEFPAGLKTSRPGGHLIRSLVGVTSMALWFTGVQRLPLADALAISYAAPLLTVALAGILLGELVRRSRWVAVAIGFVGVVVVLSPHLGSMAHLTEDRAAMGAAVCFASVFFTSIAQIQISRLTETEHTGAIVVYFSAGSAVAMVVTVPFGWVMPDGFDLLMLIGSGLFGGFGQILLTQAYKHADASVVAPLEYASMLWAILSGWLLFAEVPTLTVLIGAAVVVASGIVVVVHERRIES